MAAQALVPGRRACDTRRMPTVYCYQKCSTCRDALKWLEHHGIAHQVRAIRQTPPSVAELRSALDALGGEVRKLFNTSGIDYRAQGLKDRLPAMTVAEALELLSNNGNLVKRPFLIDGATALVGFNPDLWQRALVAGTRGALA